MSPSRAFFPFFLLAFSLLGSPARADEISDLVDVPASEWRQHGLSPLFARLEKHSGKAPLRITVHFTDEPKNYDKSLEEKLRTLFRYSLHTIEGTKHELWGDIPYHYFIDARGKLGECRNPSFQPDSNTSYNRDGHIAIVIEGDTKDGITAAQKKKLYALIQALQEKYHVPTGRVGVHRNYAQTDCPGEAITAAVREYKAGHADSK